jgi:hypothetical protein
MRVAESKGRARALNRASAWWWSLMPLSTLAWRLILASEAKETQG